MLAVGFMQGSDHVRAERAARDLNVVDAQVQLINLEALEYSWIWHRSPVSPTVSWWQAGTTRPIEELFPVRPRRAGG